VDAINRVDAISRTECARVARERFDRTVMAAGYGRVYESVAAIASRR
jgi:hypothetical protein